MKKVCGIYGIRSISHPERAYIGSAVDITKRWDTHIRQLQKGNHVNARLSAHYNKHSISDLVFEIIIQCDKESLIKAEQVYIDLYKPWFNICPTAGSQLGFRHSIESRQKMSKRMLGNTYALGLCHSTETKKRMSENRKGRVVSEKTRELMSKGRGCPVLNTETNVCYNSIRAAARALGIDRDTLGKYLRQPGKNKTKLILI